MNLVLLPGTDEWDSVQQGETVSYALPHGDYDFTVSRDDELGTYLSAILFRSVNSIPTQAIALGIAEEIAELVFTESEPDTPMRKKRPIGRREFLTGLSPN
jgi:[NiFe] hydrogenase assembly HybE family chaperone